MRTARRIAACDESFSLRVSPGVTQGIEVGSKLTQVRIQPHLRAAAARHWSYAEDGWPRERAVRCRTRTTGPQDRQAVPAWVRSRHLLPRPGAFCITAPICGSRALRARRSYGPVLRIGSTAWLLTRAGIRSSIGICTTAFHR